MANEIVVISKDELQTLIIDCVNTCLKFYVPKQPVDNLPELLSRHQVAEFLSISIGTVDNLSRDGVLKKHKLGGVRTPRFKRQEVREAFENWTKHQRTTDVTHTGSKVLTWPPA